MSWAILIAAVEIIAIYLILTVVSYIWQARNSGVTTSRKQQHRLNDSH